MSLINLIPRPLIVIHRGDRIAQLVVQQVELPELVEVASFDEAGPLTPPVARAVTVLQADMRVCDGIRKT